MCLPEQLPGPHARDSGEVWAYRQSAPAGDELVDPDRIPLPPSAPGSDYGRRPIDHSRRPSLVSVRSQNDLSGDVPAMEPLPAPSTSRLSIPLAPSLGVGPHDPSFTNVMRLVQRAQNARSRAVALQRELLHLLFECGSQTRCLGMQSYLYKRLVECFRNEAKPAFVSLFEQMETSVRGEPSSREADIGKPPEHYQSGERRSVGTSWISTFPTHARTALMRLLNNLRTKPAFLADRISSLKTSQLRNLAKPHLPSGRTESADSSPNSRLDLRLLRPWAKTSPQCPDEVPQDPLRVMILSCFDVTSTRGYSERGRLLDVWSTACARLIEDQRQGSNEFCFAVLEIFAELSSWDLNTKLELLLLELMHTGSFLLGNANGSNTAAKSALDPAEVSASAFFDQAVETLLDLLTSSASFSVPDVALDLIHATLRKLDDPLKIARARRFFVFTWYCNTFLFNALLFPEVSHTPAPLYFVRLMVGRNTTCSSTCTSVQYSDSDCSASLQAAFKERSARFLTLGKFDIWP